MTLFCDGTSDEDAAPFGVYPTGQFFGQVPGVLGINTAAAAGAASKALTGGLLDVGSLFKRDKDPGRLAGIAALEQRARAGDRAALDQLKAARYATDKAKAASRAAYNRAAPLYGVGGPFGPKPGTPGTPATPGTPGTPAIIPPVDPGTGQPIVYQPGGDTAVPGSPSARPSWLVPALVIGGLVGFNALKKSRGSQTL